MNVDYLIIILLIIVFGLILLYKKIKKPFPEPPKEQKATFCPHCKKQIVKRTFKKNN